MGYAQHSLDHYYWLHCWSDCQIRYIGGKEPQGFILTTALGIVGAVVATYLGQALGWYHAGEKAGFIGAIVGAVLILLVLGFIERRRRTELHARAKWALLGNPESAAAGVCH
jgi:uncharacterized membrane protein YeaQ/YmgE (transglycosylase-associated protein family)